MNTHQTPCSHRSQALRLRFAAVVAILLAALVNPVQAAVVFSETFDTGVTFTNWNWTGGGYVNPPGADAQAWNQNTTANQFFVRKFSPISLYEGDKLVLSFNYDTVSANINSVWVGLFNGTEPTADGWNQWAGSGVPSNDWIGYVGRFRKSADLDYLGRAEPADTHPFWDAATLTTGSASTLIHTSGTNRAARLTLENTGTNVVITLDEGTNFTALATVMTYADDTLDRITGAFNLASFYFTTTSGNGEIRYDNVTLEHIANTNVPVSITAAPTNTTVIENQTLTLAVTAAGSPPYTYQWTLGGTNIAGATNAVYSKTAALSDAGNYAVIVGGSYGNLVTSTPPAVVTVLADQFPPVVNADPASATRYFGRSVTFSASVGGTLPMTFQWRHAGTNLPGANAVSLTLTNLGVAQTGNYQLFVTNAYGNTSSAVATLTLISPVAGSYEQMILTNNPVSYWRFNEPGANPAVWRDYVGGNDLANSSTVASDVGMQAGYPGFESTNTAASYNGTDSASEAAGPLMNSMTRFTVCGWYNAGTSGSWGTPLFGQDDLAELGFHPNLGVWVPGSPSSAFVEYPYYSVGTWQFVAAVYDGTNVLLYVDGGLVGSQSLAAFDTDSTRPFSVGYGTLYDGGYFLGLIDEVALFDRALSAVQVNDLYSKALGQAPVVITIHPSPKTVYSGSTVTFTVQASGSTPMTNRWLKGASYLSNGGRISGANTSTLTISNVSAADADNYSAEVSNVLGPQQSNPALLTVVQAPTSNYPARILALQPAHYWRLNEDSATYIAADYVGGLTGSYQGGSSAWGFTVPGPVGFGFESDNTGFRAPGVSGSAVVIPPLGLTTAHFTMTAWVKPPGLSTWQSFVYTRGTDGNIAGLHYSGVPGVLHYTWKDTYWDWNSGLVIPANQWSFIAMVVTPTNGTVYVGTPGVGLASNTTNAPQGTMTFNANLNIGQDSPGGGYYNGDIDEVALYNRPLTPAEIEGLFANGGGPVRLTVGRSGANAVLNWPVGTLQSADEVNGTYGNVSGATSPWTVSPTAARKFYRVRVQ